MTSILLRLAAMCTLALCLMAWNPLRAAEPAAVTPNSECGKLATGYRADDLTTVVTYQSPGMRVDARGVWSQCPIVFEKPVPRNCVVETAKSWGACRDDRARGATILHGNTVEWRQWMGAQRGQLIERCDDGTLRTVKSTCAQAAACDVAMTIEYERQPYTIDATRAPVANDDYATARAPDGATVRLRCVAGSFELAPQCGPQMLAYGGVAWRYAGPPVEVNRRMAVPAADGRKRPNGQPLTMAVTCDFSGRLMP